MEPISKENVLPQKMTRTMKAKLLLLTLFTSCCLLMQAQEFSYPIDTIDGKLFYRYPVQKSEGLYRISKNFNVSQEDLVKYNPELQSDGLKLGQVILVPYIPQIDSSKYIVHELQPKETLYGLSKKYNVKIAQIQELNPITSKSMGIGERLLIALKPSGTETQAAEPIIAEKSVEEEVGKSEAIAVTASDTTVVTPPDSAATNSLIVSTESSGLDSIQLSEQTPLRIAFCLPFMTELKKRDASVDRFVEFYQGALLALQDAQDKGQRFEIYTYDTEKGDTRIQRILADPALQNIDAIVGPAYPSQITYASEYAFSNHVPVIIPFSDKVSDIDRNPYLLRFNSSEEQEAQTLAEYIQDLHSQVKCIFLNIENSPISPTVEALREELIQRQIATEEVSESLLLTDSLTSFLSVNHPNVIIFNTEKYSAVQPYIGRLTSLKRDYNLQLLSHYAWQQADISLKQFYTSVFHTTKLIDLPLFSYNARFRRNFQTDPQTTAPRFDLLGYDLTAWLIEALQQDNSLTLKKKFEGVDYQGLQSDIRFRQMGEEGGYINEKIQVISQ